MLKSRKERKIHNSGTGGNVENRSRGNDSEVVLFREPRVSGSGTKSGTRTFGSVVELPNCTKTSVIPPLVQ